MAMGTSSLWPRIRTDWSFSDEYLFERLDAADDATLDGVPFGVVEMALSGIVTRYNTTESRLAGLSPAKVIGRHFFSEVAPCTNNFMVAQRFENELALDVILDYVFTLRMKATNVKLRLLKQPERLHMFLAVERQ